jgi:uncharacterized protein
VGAQAPDRLGAGLRRGRTNCLYFPVNAVGEAPSDLKDAERIACDTRDGERLEGIRIPPGDAEQPERTTIIGFGGNAWNAEHMGIYLHELFPEAGVVTFHYRGYAPSSGKPSSAALLSDAPSVFDCAISAPRSTRIIVIGFSIGTGVAAHLARKREVDGVILVTALDSVEQLAREHYGWLPIRLMLQHHMTPVDDLRQVAAPVALISAENDTIIPAARTGPLREVIRDLVLDRTIPETGHNDIYGHPQFNAAMRDAKRLILSKASENGLRGAMNDRQVS